MDEAQVIERIALIADDQTAEVAQPGEEPLDFPPTAIAPERTAILGLGPRAVAAVRAQSSRCPGTPTLRRAHRRRRHGRQSNARGNSSMKRESSVGATSVTS